MDSSVTDITLMQHMIHEFPLEIVTQQNHLHRTKAVGSVLLHPLHQEDDEESDGCNLEWRLEWWTIDDAAKVQRGEKAKSVRDCLLSGR